MRVTLNLDVDLAEAPVPAVAAECPVSKQTEKYGRGALLRR